MSESTIADHPHHSLSSDLKKLAIAELQEDPDTIVDSIKELRNEIESLKKDWVRSTPRDDDLYLLRFLRAKKYRMQDAVSLYISHHEFERAHELDIVNAEELFEYFLPVFWLPTNGNEKVLYCYITEKFNRQLKEHPVAYLHMLQIFWHIFNSRMLDDPEIQISGIKFLCNMSGFGLSTARSIPSEYQKIEAEMMSVLPVRMKGFLLWNCPWYLNWFINLYKLFIKEKLRKRIILVTKHTLNDHLGDCDVYPSDDPGTWEDAQLEEFHQTFLKDFKK